MPDFAPVLLVLLGALPGLLLLFGVLIRLPVLLVAFLGAVCLMWVETRVFGIAFLLFALVRFLWLRSHPRLSGAAREEYLQQEAETKSRLYEAEREDIEVARLLDVKLEEEWVAKSRRVLPPKKTGRVGTFFRTRFNAEG